MSEASQLSAECPAHEPVAQKDLASPGSISGTVRQPEARRTPTRVLIAEDDPVSRTVLERSLRGWGYDVVVTQNGTDAWDMLLADDSPRLAILDWMMPGLEGPELCRRARALA